MFFNIISGKVTGLN